MNKGKLLRWGIKYNNNLCISFIPGLNRRGVAEGEGLYFGIPADWLALYPEGGWTFMVLGFIVNSAFFYWIIYLIIKGYRKWFTNTDGTI